MVAPEVLPHPTVDGMPMAAKAFTSLYKNDRCVRTWTTLNSDDHHFQLSAPSNLRLPSAKAHSLPSGNQKWPDIAMRNQLFYSHLNAQSIADIPAHVWLREGKVSLRVSETLPPCCQQTGRRHLKGRPTFPVSRWVISLTEKMPWQIASISFKHIVQWPWYVNHLHTYIENSFFFK